jgi:hypothetical protein
VAPPAPVNPDATVREVTTPGPTAVTADVAIDTVWGPSGSPYVITGGVQVKAGASLTMLPGTVVKLGGTAASLVAVNGGQLLILGTPNARVTVTSLKDDSVLGDTNGDGDATQPAPGDWSAIRIWGANWTEAASLTPASVIDYADIRFGGYDSNPAAGQVETVYRSRFVMSNSTISDSVNGGFHDSGSAGSAGVFGDRQQYAIQFSELDAFNSGVRVAGDLPSRNIFSIPGGCTITGTCTVTRVR